MGTTSSRPTAFSFNQIADSAGSQTFAPIRKRVMALSCGRHDKAVNKSVIPVTNLFVKTYLTCNEFSTA